MARVARVISGIDFAGPNYVDDILRGSYRGNDDYLGGSGGGGDDGDDHFVGATTFDVIIHLAAMSSPTQCELDPDDAARVNCPVDLLTRFHAARVIYLSTDQVYDGTTKSRYDEDVDVPNPVNVYGRTKLSFEDALLRRSSSTSTSSSSTSRGSVILRCSLVLGPDAPLGGAHRTFLQFVEDRLRGETLTDYYVDEYRSCVHVNDVVRAIVHFMDGEDADADGGRGGGGGGGGGGGANVTTNATGGGIGSAATQAGGNDVDATTTMTTTTTTAIYNLGGRTRASRREMAVAVARRLGLDESHINAVERPRSSSSLVPSPPDISMNIDKITKALGGGREMMGLEEIVAATFPI
jgi:dTDP-4-dehydrorhamnose reductase